MLANAMIEMKVEKGGDEKFARRMLGVRLSPFSSKKNKQSSTKRNKWIVCFMKKSVRDLTLNKMYILTNNGFHYVYHSTKIWLNNDYDTSNLVQFYGIFLQNISSNWKKA